MTNRNVRFSGSIALQSDLARWRNLCGVENGVRGLLANHVDRACDEKAGDTWKDGGVYDAQTGRSVHAKIAAEDATGIPRANRAGAGRVMAPRVFANESPQLLVVLQFGAGYLLGENDVGVLQFFGHAP